MCGRTACTLAPDDVVRACGFRDRRGVYQRPVWKDAPGGQQYFPSYNVAPTSHTPVLLSSLHYPGELTAFSERVIQPMKWGLVPAWHKGDPYKLEYETNNCRAEGMLTKRTYRTALDKGNRCVVLADGFFEWKRTNHGKQPFFIYFPQSSSPTSTDTETAADKASTKPSAEHDEPDSVTWASEQKNTSLVTAASEVNKTAQESPCPHSESEQKKTAFIKKERVCLNPEPEQDNPAFIKQEPVYSKPESEQKQTAFVKQEPVYPSPESESKRCDSILKEEAVSIKPDPEVSSGLNRPEGMDAALLSPGPECGKSVGGLLTTEEVKPTLKSFVTNDMASLGVMDSHHHDNVDQEWRGKRLLTMAGVFSVWNPPDGSAPLYSYSVITVEASQSMAAVHHRMPAILNTEEEIREWLDFANVPLTKAVKVIRPIEDVTMHMVSPLVNNSRNKSPQCVEQYDPKRPQKSGSSGFMMQWLKKTSPAPHTETPDAKRHKDH